jgi:hypothetical protein
MHLFLNLKKRISRLIAHSLQGIDSYRILALEDTLCSNL